MPDARKRPCRICRRWFKPDNRVGDRQRACGKADCQAARRKKTQASWRANNPDYAIADRIQRRNRDGASAENPPGRPVPPLNKLPWDVAKDQFTGQGADFIALMGTLLVRFAKDQSKAYLADSKKLAGTLPVAPEKTSPEAAHTEARADATGVSSTGPPPGEPPGTAPGPATPAAFLTG